MDKKRVTKKEKYGGAGSPPSIRCPAYITPPLARKVSSLTHLPGLALQYTRVGSAIKQGGADMKKSRHAPRPKQGKSEASFIPGGVPGKDFFRRDKDLKLQLAAWELLSKKILFFYALTLSSCLCVFSLIALAGPFPPQLQTGAEIYLALVGASLLRSLAGPTTPLIMLITQLVKVLAAHKNVNLLK